MLHGLSLPTGQFIVVVAVVVTTATTATLYTRRVSISGGESIRLNEFV